MCLIALAIIEIIPTVGFEPTHLHIPIGSHARLYQTELCWFGDKQRRWTVLFRRRSTGRSLRLAVRVSHLNQSVGTHRYNTTYRPDDSCSVYPFHLTPDGGLLKAGSELTSG